MDEVRLLREVGDLRKMEDANDPGCLLTYAHFVVRTSAYQDEPTACRD